MSLTQVTKSTSSAPVTTMDTLVTRAKANWNNRKVEILGSAATAALVGGSAATAATIWSGPLALIVGLATAALFAVMNFFKALLSKPAAPVNTNQGVVTKAANLLKTTGSTLYNNKGKIALGAAALATGYGFYAYLAKSLPAAVTLALPAPAFGGLLPPPTLPTLSSSVLKSIINL